MRHPLRTALVVLALVACGTPALAQIKTVSKTKLQPTRDRFEPSTVQGGGVALASFGRFYVGGSSQPLPYPNSSSTTPSNNSSMFREQALVYHYVPQDVTQPYPIVMVAGLGLSSYLYTTTPDGRDGWAFDFLRAGFEVYVFEDPLTSPSGGFDISAFNEAKSGAGSATDQPELSIWSNEEIWSRWGFGSAFEVPYPDTRFPLSHVDQFYAAMPVRHEMPPGSGKFGATFKASVLEQLMQQTGPCILMGHSAGGATVVKAAETSPQLVEAFVLVEPTSPPTASNFPDFSGKVMLGVYGDYIAERNQTNRKLATEAAAALFSANGGFGEVISMPEDLLVFGNTHIMMQDDNSAQISGLVIDWLELHLP